MVVVVLEEEEEEEEEDDDATPCSTHLIRHVSCINVRRDS